ncbi:MAG: YgiQ family radical SAM protein [Clostridiaceae bacterium]|nr:YgiQ family radical SAM protein [Clostridiaceae bacterium]
MYNEFLPLTRAEMQKRGWDAPDFVFVTGDAYVDHPTFGAAILSRLLESKGYRVAILAQPDWRSADAFRTFGEPKLGFLVTSGNIDSMVAHYSVTKKRRTFDYYSPGGKMGLRPDRAVIVYANRIREAYPGAPIVIGGLEASLRRLAHYDYWDDRVRRGLLLDAKADLLIYGMGETALVRIAELLARGVPVGKIRDVRGTVYAASPDERVHYPVGGTFDFDRLCADRRYFAECYAAQYRNTDAVTGKALVERYGDRVLVLNPPQPPLEREMLDFVAELPYTRRAHPSYAKAGGVPATQEIEFSITHNRGCFGACNFCALAFHQGRAVRSRSIESVVRETELLTKLPGFKGYISDVGGPTADFREPSCEKQKTMGVCPDRKCLTPRPCPNLRADHSDYVRLLRAVERVPGVKKVFIRSGVRFDYVLADRDETFLKKLIRDHVSGQLRVAPEHCADGVLACMGKPPFEVYERFSKRFYELTRAYGLDQYLVPYLISSHPGSTLADAVTLAEYLHRHRLSPEQVQDFYPTPGTPATCMFYTGLDPFTLKPVYIARDPHEKAMQRALLQPGNPKNAALVREALHRTHREELIGFGAECLVRPAPKRGGFADPKGENPGKPGKKLHENAKKSAKKRLR